MAKTCAFKQCSSRKENCKGCYLLYINKEICRLDRQEFTICKNVKLNKLNFVIYSTQHPLKGLPRVMFKSLF